jgi:hypothetical protein
MTIGLLTDPAERFPLGVRNGVVAPTVEPVSDTALTPFGLTLRTAPVPRNVVRLRAADGVPLTMGTSEKVCLIESDGNSQDSDTQVDIIDD